MSKSQTIISSKSSRIPKWIRVVLILAGSAALTQGIFWLLEWFIGSISNEQTIIRWHPVAFFAGLLLNAMAFTAIRLTGDRLGFGIKRIIASIITGSFLLISIAVTGILFFRLGIMI